MTTDRLDTLTELTEKARHIVTAAAELMLSDELLDAGDLNSESEEKQLKIWDLLRMHNTCGSLLHTLLDVFDRIDAELYGAGRDRLEELRQHSTAPDQRSKGYTLEDGTQLADFARGLQNLTAEQLDNLTGEKEKSGAEILLKRSERQKVIAEILGNLRRLGVITDQQTAEQLDGSGDALPDQRGGAAQ